MTIQQAIEILPDSKRKTINKSETKIYNKFIGVLSNLKKREFSQIQINLIENELEKHFNLENVSSKKKHFRKALNQFTAYLKKEFSLILESHYTSLGIGLGICFGLAFGTIFFEEQNKNSIGMCIGMFVGFLIGKYLDGEAEKQNQVLKIKL